MSIIGEYFKLSLRDSNDDRVSGLTWRSSDTSVCTVDEKGVVYAVGGGTAIVCLRFGVHNLTELENVRTRLRGISGVHNVERGTE